MSTIDVGMRLGDAIDPFQLTNGFEAVIGYECQERSNHPFSMCLVLSAAFLRGNGVTRRTQKVIQGGDNGHVGRPCSARFPLLLPVRNSFKVCELVFSIQ